MNTRQHHSSTPPAAAARLRLYPTGRSVLFRSFITLIALWAVTVGVSRSIGTVNGSSSAPSTNHSSSMAESGPFPPHLWDRTLVIDASRAAAPSVENIARSYRRKHPDMQVLVRITPDRTSFERLMNLNTQVVFASRRLDDDERLRAWLLGISLTEKTLTNAPAPTTYVYARSATLKGRPLVAEFVHQATR